MDSLNTYTKKGIASHIEMFPSINTTANSFIAAWIGSQGAVQYILQVAYNPTFTNLVSGYSNIIVNDTFYDVIGLTCETSYYYRVKVQMPCNLALYSEVEEVTTTSAIVCTGSNTNTWPAIATYSTGRSYIPFLFYLNNKLYMGTGQNNYVSYPQDFYAYDLNNNTWASLSNYPIPCYDPLAITDSNLQRAYILREYSPCGYCTNQYYYWDNTTNLWKTIPIFSGEGRNNLIGIFVGLAKNCPNTYISDWWQFYP